MDYPDPDNHGLGPHPCQAGTLVLTRYGRGGVRQDGKERGSVPGWGGAKGGGIGVLSRFVSTCLDPRLMSQEESGDVRNADADLQQRSTPHPAVSPQRETKHG